MPALSEILGPNGLLSRHIKGFTCRPQQQEMAERITTAIEGRQLLITEAGTGTGKTFAYLVPVLLSGKKTIISTGTKNLQDQLFHRDLPLIREVLAVPARVALLKGRANYLCRHRLESTLLEGRLGSRQMVDQLMSIQRWSGRTRLGDIAEISGVPEESGIWPMVTSTTDNCLGPECPSYAECHLLEARRSAQEADLVVINHHLLCADFALKEGGFGDLLPAADCFVVDEAHQLAEVAGGFFGSSVSSRQLLELVRDTETEYLREAGDIPEIPKQAARLGKAVRDLRLVFGIEARRVPWLEAAADQRVVQALTQVGTELDGLRHLINEIQGRGKGLDSCLARCQQLVGELAAINQEQSENEICWVETHQQSLRLNRTPLEIADLFRERMARYPGCWVFTSATLAVGESFRHFQRRLGLEESQTARWDSPFDYPTQALWYVPKEMPDPRSTDFTRAVVDLTVEILAASHGRAFLLYTSHRALREAAELLHGRVDYPLLVQGSAPKDELLNRFRDLGNAVLLGTSSFWEGVDVRGEALSCVIIDKLPFASPGDPVLQARIDTLRRKGGNPFMELQVPQAALALKQGAGRLIRDPGDRGVLVICDRRLLKRGYGQVFLDSMPPMARTRELADVRQFFGG
ncbi:MAG: ATP-dependent DNA helicase [Gammaproteobacteria bacterium]|nr:ATP-dependent DNA helicase [Gammaproteobacteria bacterium]